MKRYRFRLEQVARVRHIQEEQARAELLASRVRLADAGADLSRRLERLDGRTPTRGRNTLNGFRAERTEGELLARAVTAARLAEANARLLVDQRVDEWTAAARETSTLERLDARARADHDAEVAREEQAQLDDLVTSRRAAADPEETRP